MHISVDRLLAEGQRPLPGERYKQLLGGVRDSGRKRIWCIFALQNPWWKYNPIFSRKTDIEPLKNIRLALRRGLGLLPLSLPDYGYNYEWAIHYDTRGAVSRHRVTASY